MAHLVKCFFCNQQFDRDKVECIQVNSRRYAHKRCETKQLEKVDQEQEEHMQLIQYLMKKFNVDGRLNPVLNAQLKKFTEEYNYTYIGILKALKYFYEVKDKGSTAQKFTGIGIVPYVYDDAQKYYYNLFMIKQKNEAKPVEQFRRVERQISIPVPVRQDKRKRRLFTFIEEED